MTGGIQDWMDSELEGYMKGVIHGKKGSMQRDLYYKRRDAVQDDTGQLVSTTGGMQDWRDAGLEGARTGGSQDWREPGLEGGRTGRMQERRDS